MVKEAKTDEEILWCFPIFLELEPDEKKSTTTAEDFLNKIKRQKKNGYQLMYVKDPNDSGEVVAISGFRNQEKLFDGKLILIEDLGILSTVRASGYGSAILDWTIRHGIKINVDAILAVVKWDQHVALKVFLNHSFTLGSYHFTLNFD